MSVVWWGVLRDYGGRYVSINAVWFSGEFPVFMTEIIFPRRQRIVVEGELTLTMPCATHFSCVFHTKTVLFVIV